MSCARLYGMDGECVRAWKGAKRPPQRSMGLKPVNIPEMFLVRVRVAVLRRLRSEEAEAEAEPWNARPEAEAQGHTQRKL